MRRKTGRVCLIGIDVPEKTGMYLRELLEYPSINGILKFSLCHWKWSEN
jgi:hypothetical protein